MAIRAAKEKFGVRENLLDGGLRIVLGAGRGSGRWDALLCSLNDEPMCAQPFNIYEALSNIFHVIRHSTLQSAQY